ncbi:MAG: site-specific integrase [Candidatus Omnitrophica bacterium]|nr:site-specific integrase [Candidatus Omnitrophota bacterium]
METRVPIEELVTKVLDELKRLNYSYHSLCLSRGFYRKFIAFAKEKQEKYFFESLGASFLKENYGFDISTHKGAMPGRIRTPLRRIRILGDYQLHGVIIRRVIKKPAYVKPPQFDHILLAYDAECERNNYSKRGMRTKMQRLYFFIDYIASRKLQDVNQITPAILSDYVKTIYRYHEKSISAILTTLRTFLKFLYLNEYTQKDLSLDVPKPKKYYSPAIPSVWKAEDVKKVLQSVDRGSPIGKRDYAILLLVAKLGIRVGDLKALKLHDLNWNTKTIEVNQSKTGRHVSYPILDDIGWALIDYLKNSRPETYSQFVFIRLMPPYEAFGGNANLHNIISKYTRLAGIKIPKGAKHGMHSLRHALASALLEQKTPLPVISAILGHLNSKSTNVYLQTGIEGLRQCALDPEEVFNHEK